MEQDYWNKLKDFYNTIFVDFLHNSDKSYICFADDLSFSTVNLLLDEKRFTFNSTKYNYIKDNIYTFNGIKLLMPKIAKQCFENENYKCKIYLCSNLLHYGEELELLLYQLETLFIEQYKKYCSDSCREYKEEHILNRFLNFINIKVLYTTKQTVNFRPRHKRLINTERSVDVSKFKEINYFYHQKIIDNDLISISSSCKVKLNQDNFNFNKNDIFTIYESKKENDYFLNQFVVKRINDTMGQDMYILPLVLSKKINCIFMIVCGEKYITSFNLIPDINEDVLQNTLKCIIQDKQELLKYNEIMPNFPDTNKINTNNVQLLHSIFSIIVLKEFIGCLGLSNIHPDIKTLMANYAHMGCIENLIKDLWYNNEYSFSAIKKAIEDHFRTACLCQNFCATKNSDMEQFFKVAHTLLYEQKIKCKEDLFRLSNSSFHSSYMSVNNLVFPYKNNVSYVLSNMQKDVHQDNVCLDGIICLLQLFICGDFEIVIAKRDSLYIHCIRPTQKTMIRMMKKYIDIIPILYEIELRCKRQGRTPKSAFISELDYFLLLFGKNNSQNEKYIKITENRDEIDEIVNNIYSCGEEIEDYLFVLNLFFKDHKDKEKYMEVCKQIYYKTIY